MSGVMIKTGVYGLMRMLMMLGTPPAWWGWTLVFVGAVSGVMGILMSLTQHDLKRVLAYSSVENVGIIGMGLGLWLIGQSYDQPALSLLGAGGAMLHILNHAMFKGMLFLAAGAVLHGTGTRIMDLLGGLGKRMPWTAGVFALGAVAICGLPPLNGFMGEFLLYFGCYGGTLAGGATAAASLVVVAALALIGGLAVASFTRAFGIVFLGAGRTQHAAHAHEAGGAMKVAMGALAAACMALAITAPAIVMWMGGDVLRGAGALMTKVLTASAIFLLLLVGLAWLRRFLLRGRSVEQAGTWDCGYADPNARIQYTGSSFAQPITALMRIFHRGRAIVQPPQGLFPEAASMETRTPDVFTEGVFRPVFMAVAWVVARLRWLQHGRIQLYVLYIALAVLALMVWKLG
jgi:formate hydrogenlyase subunit 3/multisubunit Na+/H+ antiporter MnhD subunit